MSNHPQKTSKAVRTAHSAADQEDENMPKRIQRKRSLGWRMPESAVYVGRGTKWGNPFVVQVAPKGMVGAYPMTDNRYAVIDTRDNAPRGNYKLFLTFHDAARYAVGQFRWWSLDQFTPEDYADIAGHDVACWCAPGAACHADYLLEQANKPQPAAIES